MQASLPKWSRRPTDYESRPGPTQQPQRPAITEIDSLHLRGVGNRRGYLILSESPSIDVDAREFVAQIHLDISIPSALIALTPYARPRGSPRGNLSSTRCVTSRSGLVTVLSFEEAKRAERSTSCPNGQYAGQPSPLPKG